MFTSVDRCIASIGTFARPMRRLLTILTLLIITISLTGCIQAIIADEMLKAPNPDASSFTIKVKNGQDVSTDLPFIFDEAYTIEVGPPSALLTYFVIEPKPNYYYIHADFSLHSDKDWLKAVDQNESGPIATNARTISMSKIQHQLCMAIAHPAMSEQKESKRIVQPRGTVILMQGHSGYTRKEPYLWPLAAVLANNGYRVIMPDLRGQGDSTGEQISYGKYEANDLKQLVDDLEYRNLLDGNLAIMGHSYGSMMSIFAAANDPRISAIISISPHNRMIDPTAAMNIARIFHPDIYDTIESLGGAELLQTGIREAASRIKVDPNTFSPAQQLKKIKTPLLLLHGTEDQICPTYASAEIMAARPKYTRRILFPTDDHWSLLYRQSLWQSVITFLDSNLTPDQPPRIHAIEGVHYKPMQNVPPLPNIVKANDSRDENLTIN
ncbi:alpha/beta fold hydrolase [Planctomycetota bacterium]|nr:alpha/beta fold hydrolase [Planctomycetota bacterium]